MTIINDKTIIEHLTNTHFICQFANKYTPQSYIGNSNCDCLVAGMTWCEDEDQDVDYLQKNIVFQYICDGFIELLQRTIGERNETDETECDQWECNNTYTHCNGIWNCPDGADEGGCRSSRRINLFFTSPLMCFTAHKSIDVFTD